MGAWKKLLTFWDRDDSLTAFLWLLAIFIFIIGPTAGLSSRLEVFIDLFFGIVLIAGVWATLSSPRIAILTVVFVTLVFGTSFSIFFLGPNSSLETASHFFKLPPMGLMLLVVLKQTMKDGPITAHRVKGAVAAYLLIGVFCARAYMLIAYLVPNSFSGNIGTNSSTSLLYFSFVTLTTVGYGDIVPTQQLARSLANAEAFVGQLFPAIFIARIVTLQIESRRRT